MQQRTDSQQRGGNMDQQSPYDANAAEIIEQGYADQQRKRKQHQWVQ